MTYATRADLAARYGMAEIADLARDDDGRIESALADASAEIDAALATLYVVPLEAVSRDEAATEPPTWPVLTGIACDIARAHLYDDRESEAVTNRKRSARARLRSLAEDKGTIVDGDGKRARRRETAQAERTGAEPAMTQDNLAGLA